jgi:hypothetical protein
MARVKARSYILGVVAGGTRYVHEVELQESEDFARPIASSSVRSRWFWALLSELEQAGVLGGEANGRIKDSISNPHASGARELDRVYGIDGYFE